MTYEDTVKAVGAIRFTVFSPSDIRKYSVTEITAPETRRSRETIVPETRWSRETIVPETR